MADRLDTETIGACKGCGRPVYADDFEFLIDGEWVCMHCADDARQPDAPSRNYDENDWPSEDPYGYEGTH